MILNVNCDFGSKMVIYMIPEMTRLDEAMLRHMKDIVKVEYRPFSYLDFDSFEVDNHYYSVPHGTCRNKFFQFVKWGIIELDYNSKVSYYTLKGYRFAKSSMTRNHMGISSVIPVTGVIGIEMQELFNHLHTVPSTQNSVHDIHYMFTVPGIYKIMSSNPTYGQRIKPFSYDIILNPEIIDGLKITAIIHRTDTVTVSVACSATPIPITEEGITNLSCAMTRMEERLSFKLCECGNSSPGGYKSIPIPDNRRWIVTMWHFGKDKKHEYKNGYSLTWGYGREVLRIYTRTIQGQQVERTDLQEYPKKPFADAVKEKSTDCNVQGSDSNRGDRNGH